MAGQAIVGSAMKTKLGLVILAVACGGMMVALFAMKKVADEQLKRDTDAILDFSNQLVTARSSLDDLGQVNLRLTNDLAASRQEMLVFSNQFTEASGALTVTKVSLQNAQEQIAGLNKRITGLTTQNQVLDQRAAALSSAISALNMQIAETRQRLSESETNNTFLEKELQRQTAARTELEGKFNNLTTVRAQVKKLKEDLVVSRRLQWMQAGTDPGSPPMKGGQLQMQRVAPAADRAPHYDLNVEVSSDGAIRVMPMANNLPAPASPPPP
jgi:PIN domain nuclease of toxin-antitoxin system